MRKTFSILFWLVVWQLLALWVDNEILLVSPVRAVVRFFTLLLQPELGQVICHSLGRIGTGFLLGTIAGVFLAVCAGRFSFLEELSAPVMTLCKTVPVASFVVLLLIWWGSAYLAVAVCFLVVLPNIYISTLAGIRSTDEKLLEMAGVFQMPLWNRFFYIYRPALRPFVESSLKLSLGMCWKSGVAAELIGITDLSLGERLYFAKIHMDTADLFAWTAVIILVSVVFERLVLFLMEQFWNWEPECRERRKETVKRTLAEGRTGELQISNLTKHYAQQELWKDFHAVYRRGETYYFTGASGSGKTTFFRILCGLEQADGGNVEPDLHYCVMFQEDRLCEAYSAVKNVEMVLGDAKRARAALEGLLEPEALDKPCSQLSGGMKRRVALVRAMEAAGDCVILDEPFTGMDAQTRKRAEQYIAERQRDRILLIATHVMQS